MLQPALAALDLTCQSLGLASTAWAGSLAALADDLSRIDLLRRLVSESEARARDQKPDPQQIFWQSNWRARLAMSPTALVAFLKNMTARGVEGESEGVKC